MLQLLLLLWVWFLYWSFNYLPNVAQIILRLWFSPQIGTVVWFKWWISLKLTWYFIEFLIQIWVNLRTWRIIVRLDKSFESLYVCLYFIYIWKLRRRCLKGLTCFNSEIFRSWIWENPRVMMFYNSWLWILRFLFLCRFFHEHDRRLNRSLHLGTYLHPIWQIRSFRRLLAIIVVIWSWKINYARNVICNVTFNIFSIFVVFIVELCAKSYLVVILIACLHFYYGWFDFNMSDGLHLILIIIIAHNDGNWW